jgi:hypothetical protein
MSRNEIEDQLALYTGPPPSRAVPSPPSAPPLGLLVASIINSSNHLFFILHSLGNPNTCKWWLVRVAFSNSTSLFPSCLQDGRFLMEFYTLHYTTFGSTQPTNDIGCNTISLAKLPPLLPPQKCISFGLPILPKPTPHIINLCLFVVG